MKLETLKKNNLKKGFLIVSIFLVIVLAIVLNITKAKYKVTTNAKLVQDTIDYKLPDLTVLGIYVKDKGETDIDM